MPLLLNVLLACGGTDLVLRDTYDSGKDTTTTPTTDTEPTDPGAEDCPWVGTWELSSAKCGAKNYGDWVAVYKTTLIEMRHNHEEGCDILLTLTNEDCSETVTWWLDPETPETSATVQIGEPPQYPEAPYGTTSCDPEACQFAPSAAPCTLGAHQAEQTVGIDPSDPGSLTLTYFATYAAPTCDDVLKLTFTKQQ